jgi:hypothetical protein
LDIDSAITDEYAEGWGKLKAWLSHPAYGHPGNEAECQFPSRTDLVRFAATSRFEIHRSGDGSGSEICRKSSLTIVTATA